MRIGVAGGSGLVGRYVVDAAQRQGYQVVVLSRSNGIEVRSGHALESALDGVAAIVDVTNPGSGDRDRPTAFFADVAGRLQTVGADCRVGHIVTLSIVGIERAPENRERRCQAAQEQIALAGPVPATILRATQFQSSRPRCSGRASRDTAAHVPNMRVQSVAARTAANVLVELVGGPPLGNAPDLGGPEEADLASRWRASLSNILRCAFLCLPPRLILPFPMERRCPAAARASKALRTMSGWKLRTLCVWTKARC